MSQYTYVRQPKKSGVSLTNVLLFALVAGIIVFSLSTFIRGLDSSNVGWSVGELHTFPVKCAGNNVSGMYYIGNDESNVRDAKIVNSNGSTIMVQVFATEPGAYRFAFFNCAEGKGNLITRTLYAVSAPSGQ